MKTTYKVEFGGTWYKRTSERQYRYAAYNPYRQDITTSPVSWHATGELAKKSAGQFGEVKRIYRVTRPGFMVQV